jgi:hypothetical protein
MDFITIILLSIAIILVILITKYLYNGIVIEYFSEQLPGPVQELLKIQIKLGEQAQKVQDAIDKSNAAPQVPYVSSTADDKAVSQFLKGADSNASREPEKVENDDEEQELTEGIFQRAESDDKTPIFNFIAFNEFIKNNPQPSLPELAIYIGNDEMYDNFIDVLYNVVKDELEKMNKKLKEVKERFVGNQCSLKEGFRSVCFNIPDDAPPVKCSDSKSGVGGLSGINGSAISSAITPDKLNELNVHVNKILAKIRSPDNQTKLLFIDKSFEVLNTMKKKGESGNTQEFINDYAPDARPPIEAD